METDDGLKPIEDIKEGDYVLAYNERTGEQEYKQVLRLFRNETTEWYNITVNGETLTCTGGHPFYVPVLDRFLTARELQVGTKLLLSDGSCGIIEAIEIQQLDVPETTYNFEVEDFHTYYVGTKKVLCHNTCIFDDLGVKDFNEVGTKYTPDELIDKLDELGYSKEITIKSTKSGPATIMKKGNLKFRIQGSPGVGNPYFRVFRGDNPLNANGVFPSWASKAEVRMLTHFYFGGS